MTLSCGAAFAGAPVSGVGASAKCSRIYLIPPGCTTDVDLSGTAPGNISTSKWFNEQVVRIEVRPMVSHRAYCHDKSYCCMDETDGPHSWSGSIQTRIQCCSNPFSITAGALCWLAVYPLGSVTGTPDVSINGYAKITEDPIIMGIENGDPVEHNYTFVSKGKWNVPTGLTGFQDCCNCCEQASLDAKELHGGLMEGSVFAAGGGLTHGLTKNPHTVYQWTDKGEWIVALDECDGNFMPGPMPTEPGKFPGEMKFVKCLAA